MMANKEDYPKPARAIGYDEMMHYTDQLAIQVRDYAPDEIIGVARSGLPFAAFIGQKLGLDVGYFNPKVGRYLQANDASRRVYFVDENFVSGGTQREIREFMAQHHPEVEYQIGCVMLDLFCPDRACDHGVLLDFWADSMACFFKGCDISVDRGVRFRDADASV
jgi:adenine/guanine phosphoribosyltransferase-like PRPP-binding protein